jgi:glyoxalase family protein
MTKNVLKEMVVMSKKTAGIHHITAIVGHPQENVDFYAVTFGQTNGEL